MRVHLSTVAGRILQEALNSYSTALRTRMRGPIYLGLGMDLDLLLGHGGLPCVLFFQGNLIDLFVISRSFHRG